MSSTNTDPYYDRSITWNVFNETEWRWSHMWTETCSTDVSASNCFIFIYCCVEYQISSINIEWRFNLRNLLLDITVLWDATRCSLVSIYKTTARKLAMKLCRKPTHTSRCLHFKFDNPRHLERGIVHSSIRRAKVIGQDRKGFYKGIRTKAIIWCLMNIHKISLTP
jgi:hypothetical protein